ncbi:MAG: SDR family oxidoreductase [Woeseia sp.]
MKDFTNKVAIVTGAASGIGRALAAELAGRGCRLVLADLDRAGLDALATQLAAGGTEYIVAELDVSDRAAVEKLARDVEARFGTANLLFNNAGVTLIDSVDTMNYEDAEWLMGINFWGVVYCSKAFLPLMLASGDAHIVNMSSLFGLCAAPLQAAYSASKFAVRGFSDSMKIELDGTGVEVSCVHPGGVKTSITRNSRFGAFAAGLSRDELNREFDKRAKTTPASAAAQILKGVAKNRRRIIVGNDARIADWIARLFPTRYDRLLRFKRGLNRGAIRAGSGDG